ncbi:Immunoglobulin-like fold [Phytophthora cinnamomi]|uniref:Immunoglobulin-like fold n=1 Tax=Phytophthora cinnamomi TaxID=4785 RepID=UPI00355ACCED|nr:Immunoglobulin-like fold [Phytophthora cinnamomi]
MLCVALLLVSSRSVAPRTCPVRRDLVSPASDSAVRVQFFPPLHVKPEGVNGAPCWATAGAGARGRGQTFTVAAEPVWGTADLRQRAAWPRRRAWRGTRARRAGDGAGAASTWTRRRGALALQRGKNGFVYTVTFDGGLDVQPPNRALSFEGAHTTTGVPGFYPEVWEVVSTDSANAQVLAGTFDLSVGFEGYNNAAGQIRNGTGKKNRRGKSYQDLENLELAKAYVHVSTDALVGIPKSAETFWTRIKDKMKSSEGIANAIAKEDLKPRA